MLKEFSTKLRERSCGEKEYIKPVDVADFVKYDKEIYGELLMMS